MNEASEWRLTVAQTVAPVYAAIPDVRAVIVAGSVARGCADRYSDIELVAFWTRPPTEGERAGAMERLGGVPWGTIKPQNPTAEYWSETFHVDDLKFDVAHYTVEAAERRLGDVTERFDTADSKQKLASVVQHAVPLHGHEVVGRWRSRATAYPEELAGAMVKRYLVFLPGWALELLAERDDLLLLYEHVVLMERNVLGVLSGLNRIYFPGTKWMDGLVGEMAVAPPNLAARLKRVLRSEPATGVKQLHALIEETIDLVERHMPAVNVSDARERFRHRREPFDRPPDQFVEATGRR